MARNQSRKQAQANFQQSAEAQAEAIVASAALENAEAIEQAEAAIEAHQNEAQAAIALPAWPYPKAPIEAASAAEIEAEAEAEAEALAIEQRKADAIANAIMAAQNAPSARSGEKKPYIRQSSIIRPTKAVWAIADQMYANAEEFGLPKPSRGEIITECIARGIASGTSATQYQAWKKAMGY